MSAAISLTVGERDGIRGQPKRLRLIHHNLMGWIDPHEGRELLPRISFEGRSSDEHTFPGAFPVSSIRERDYEHWIHATILVSFGPGEPGEKAFDAWRSIT